MPSTMTTREMPACRDARRITFCQDMPRRMPVSVCLPGALILRPTWSYVISAAGEQLPVLKLSSNGGYPRSRPEGSPWGSWLGETYAPRVFRWQDTFGTQKWYEVSWRWVGRNPNWGIFSKPITPLKTEDGNLISLVLRGNPTEVEEDGEIVTVYPCVDDFGGLIACVTEWMHEGGQTIARTVKTIGNYVTPMNVPPFWNGERCECPPGRLWTGVSTGVDDTGCCPNPEAEKLLYFRDLLNFRAAGYVYVYTPDNPDPHGCDAGCCVDGWAHPDGQLVYCGARDRRFRVIGAASLELIIPEIVELEDHALLAWLEADWRPRSQGGCRATATVASHGRKSMSGAITEFVPYLCRTQIEQRERLSFSYGDGRPQVMTRIDAARWHWDWCCDSGRVDSRANYCRPWSGNPICTGHTNPQVTLDCEPHDEPGACVGRDPDHPDLPCCGRMDRAEWSPLGRP